VWQLPTAPYDLGIGSIVNYIVVMLCNPELALVKPSVLFFLHRLGGHHPVHPVHPVGIVLGLRVAGKLKTSLI
jgi:hypothetical protein